MNLQQSQRVLVINKNHIRDKPEKNPEIDLENQNTKQFLTKDSHEFLQKQNSLNIRIQQNSNQNKQQKPLRFEKFQMNKILDALSKKKQIDRSNLKQKPSQYNYSSDQDSNQDSDQEYDMNYQEFLLQYQQQYKNLQYQYQQQQYYQTSKQCLYDQLRKNTFKNNHQHRINSTYLNNQEQIKQIQLPQHNHQYEHRRQNNLMNTSSNHFINGQQSHKRQNHFIKKEKIPNQLQKSQQQLIQQRIQKLQSKFKHNIKKIFKITQKFDPYQPDQGYDIFCPSNPKLFTLYNIKFIQIINLTEQQIYYLQSIGSNYHLGQRLYIFRYRKQFSENVPQPTRDQIDSSLHYLFSQFRQYRISRRRFMGSSTIYNLQQTMPNLLIKQTQQQKRIKEQNLESNSNEFQSKLPQDILLYIKSKTLQQQNQNKKSQFNFKYIEVSNNHDLINHQILFDEGENKIQISKNIPSYQICSICQMQIPSEYFLNISSYQKCKHKYCSLCLVNYVRFQIQTFKKVICPHQECQQQLTQGSILFQSLNKQGKIIYNKLLLYEKILQNKNLKICSKQICSGIIDHTIGNHCPQCKTIYCKKCFLQEHLGRQCSKNQIQIFMSLSKDKFLKKCRQCNMFIQKKQGCNHMTCRCGYQFCFDCQQSWYKEHNCPRNCIQKLINGAHSFTYTYIQQQNQSLEGAYITEINQFNSQFQDLFSNFLIKLNNFLKCSYRSHSQFKDYFKYERVAIIIYVVMWICIWPIIGLMLVLKIIYWLFISCVGMTIIRVIRVIHLMIKQERKIRKILNLLGLITLFPIIVPILFNIFPDKQFLVNSIIFQLLIEVRKARQQRLNKESEVMELKQNIGSNNNNQTIVKI